MTKNLVKRDPHALYCDDPSLTKQDPAKEADINYIVKMFTNQHGVDLTKVHGNVQGGFYGDFSNVKTYAEAFEEMRLAEDMFMSLPPQVRLKFDNDPGKFLEFCEDDKNYDRMVEMGLAEPRPVADTTTAEPK